MSLDTSIIHSMMKQVKKLENKIVLRFLNSVDDPGTTLTNTELFTRAASLQRHIREHTKPGDRVLLLYPQGIDFLISFVATLMAGAIAIPTYPPSRSRLLTDIIRLEHISRDANPELILTTSDLAQRLENYQPKNEERNQLQGTFSLKNKEQLEIQKTTVLITDNIEISLSDADSFTPHTKPTDIAFLQYTSGSTGEPKGVMVSHKNLVANSDFIQKSFDFTHTNKSVSWLPQYHDMGLIGQILSPVVYTGAEVNLCSPTSFIQNPMGWLKLISKFKATISGGPNFAYDLCVKAFSPDKMHDIDLSHWRIAFNGAEPISAKTLDDFKTTFAPYGFNQNNFLNLYGMAEHTLMISSGVPRQPTKKITIDQKQLTNNRLVKTSDNHSSKTFIGCGTALKNHTIQIVCPNSLRKLADEQIGEIWCQGESVAQGYWNNTALTKATFHAITNDEKGPYLRTGDLGFLKDNEIYIVGRCKDMIIIRGKNYAPQDLELTIEGAHPAIQTGSCAAFSSEINKEEKLVVVCEISRHYLRKNPSTIFTQIQQAIALRHNLSLYDIVLLKPTKAFKTTSGKIQRKKTKSAYENQTLVAHFQLVSHVDEKTSAISNTKQNTEGSSIASELATWIQKQNSSLDMQTIFSAELISMGLDSLTSIDFIEHIHNNYFKLESSKEKINLANLFEFKTLNKLATSIQTIQSQETSDIKIKKNSAPIQIIKTNTDLEMSSVFSKKMRRHQKLIRNLHKIPNFSSQYNKLKKSDTRLNQPVPPFLSESFKGSLQHTSNRTMSFEKIWRFRSALSIPIYLYNKSLMKSIFPELVTMNQALLDQLCNSDSGGICLFMHTFLNLTITIPLIVSHLHEQGREIIGVTDEPEVAEILNGKLANWLGITPAYMRIYCLRDLSNITKVNDVINRKGFVIMLPDRFKTDFQEPCNELLDFSILETSPKATFSILKDKTMGMYIKTIAEFTQNGAKIFPFSAHWGKKSTPEIKLHYTPDCKDQIPDIMQSMLSNFHLGFNEWMYTHRNINQFLNDSARRD